MTRGLKYRVFLFLDSYKDIPQVVKTNSGSVRGTITYLRMDPKPVFTFHNIPYAAPPVHGLRFSNPKPVEPWSGVRDATAHGNA